MLKAHTPGPRKGADFLVHVDPKQLKAQGVEIVGIYLKNTTKGQVKAYHDAGISVFLIHQRGYEGRGPDPIGDGKKHGLEATAQARALGYPMDCPIVFASMGDYDNTAATLKGSLDYWRAAKETCGYPMGAYGDYELLAAIAALRPDLRGVLNVQAAARGWSYDWVKMQWRGLHPSAHIEQRPSKSVAVPSGVWAGVRVDPLNIIQTVKLWANDLPDKLVKVPPPVLRRRWGPWVNRNVTWLQRQLAMEGWYAGPFDGKFDKDVEASVRWMQATLRIPATGIYDTLTAAKWQAYLSKKAG